MRYWRRNPWKHRTSRRWRRNPWRRRSLRRWNPWRRNPEYPKFPRMIDRVPEGGGDHTRECEYPGCMEKTKLGKPFCKEHVEETPYAASLMARIEAQKEEVGKVAAGKTKAIRSDSITLNEILMHLSVYGERTLLRLARDLNLEPDIVEVYVNDLKNKGKVVLGRTLRGGVVVKLVKGNPQEDYCRSCNCHSCCSHRRRRFRYY